MPNLTDLKTVRALCERHGFSLSKGFGQNFIVNPGICPKMVEAAGIDRSFGVLEIGPGKALSGFFKKTAPEIKTYHIDTADDYRAFVSAWKGESQ